MIDNILRNLTRLGLMSIYPAIIILCFILIWRKDNYHKTIKDNHQKIIFISAILSVLIILGLAIYFHFEDTIYVYDFAGHWKRSLILKKMLYEDPNAILHMVYTSMVEADYSFLPALFNLPFILLNPSYEFFCISTYIVFLIPTIILFLILYFTYFDKKILPSLIGIISFFPLYIILFNGEVDASGTFFVLMSIALIIMPQFDQIDWIDNLSMNLFGFLMIFLRRWYLYSLVGIYIAYFVKYLIYYKWKLNKHSAYDFLKIFCSGLLLLITIVLFFNPFLMRVLNNNYSEAYEFYNHAGKIMAFIKFYSPIILLISIYGFYKFYKNNKNKDFTLLFLIMIILPIVMFWHIQSLEYHHYNMINIYILFIFVYGLSSLFDKNNLIKIIVSLLLIAQIGNIFIPGNENSLLFTNIKKIPEIRKDKQEIIDFSIYLKSITSAEHNIYAYMAFGDRNFNDDLLRNALLPDLNYPEIVTAIFDLRDGFPKNLKHINYILISNPVLYMDQNYQHIYDVITNALLHEPKIKKLYKEEKTFSIGELDITVFKKTQDWTDETKEYFYNEMLKYYPDKGDYFSYILD